MAGEVKGVYVGEVTGQRFKIIPVKGADTTIFEMDVKIAGKESPDGSVSPSADVAMATVGLFMTPEELSAAPATWPDGSKRDKTVDVLKFLGCAGLKFSQLDPDTAGYYNLAGKKLKLYGKPNAKNPQFTQWRILTTGRASKTNTKGAASKLDALFYGALGKPTQAQTEESTDTSSDEVPF